WFRLRLLTMRLTPRCTLFPYTTLFRSSSTLICSSSRHLALMPVDQRPPLRRSEEHTTELQSRQSPVCRLLLEKKKSLGTPSKTPRQSQIIMHVDQCAELR